MTIITNQYKGFIQNGALDEENKSKLRELNQELSSLSIQFSKKNLAETNSYQLIVKDEARLKGIPETALLAQQRISKARRKDDARSLLFNIQVYYRL